MRQLPGGNWHARVQVNGSRGKGRVVLGTYPTREEAVSAIESYKENYIKVGHLLAWDDADNLTEQDWLVAKWPTETRDVAQVSIPQKFTKQSSFGKPRIGPETFEVDEEFLWMIGIYLAEGCPITRGICFSLHAEETEYQDRLLKYFSALGYRPSLDLGPGLRASVRIHSANLADWFPRWLGSGCSNKAIPEELMRLPKEKTWALIRGVYDGDGSKRDKEITQTSEVLALQLSELLHRVGEQPLIRTQISRVLTPIGNRRKPAYCVGWAEDTYPNKNRKGRWAFQEELLTRIRKLDRVPYTGPVYNLEVEGDHTYVVNGVTTHNCFGVGIVGGYLKHGTELITIDVTYENVRTVNVLPTYESRLKPTPFTLVEGATFGFIEATLRINPNIGEIDAIFPVTDARDGRIDAFIKSPADAGFVAFNRENFRQRLFNPTLEVRIELRSPTISAKAPRFSCLHLRYQRLTDLVVLANIPRTQKSNMLTDLGVTDEWETQHFWLDNLLKSITTEDFVGEATGPTRWKIHLVNEFAPNDQLLSWDIDTRLIHPYEPYSRVPR